jgi:hypothetical protein
MEVKKVEEKKEVVVFPLRVLRRKENIIVIEGVTIYPGITVVPSQKREKLLANPHFQDQVEAGYIEVMKDIPMPKAEDSQIAFPPQPITGDMDVDQTNAILSTPQVEAVQAIKGDAKKNIPGILNISVLKKVAAKDTRSVVVVAAEQQIAMLSKPDSEKE